MEGIRIGEITHYYNQINVAVIYLSGTIRIGDDIHILGRTTDYRQNVTSLQIEHQSIEEASPSQEVALKVTRRVRRGDKVFKLTGEN
jgi:translation elongation factor EF-1alpha